SDAGITNVRVDGVGEINGRRIAWKYDHLSTWRESIDLFGVQVHFERGHELTGVMDFPLPLNELAQPRDPLIVFRGSTAALFVLPVCSDALFGDAVHFLGANLHLEMLASGAHHRRMQRLVEVRPRDGDEILDSPWNRVPFVMNYP